VKFYFVDNRKVIAMFKRLFVLVVAFSASVAYAQDNKGPTEWTSAPCTSLALGPTEDISHLQRIYLLGPAGHTTQYKFFADDQCKLPLYSFVFIGGVKMGAAVKDVPDAVEATVTFKRVLFTLDSPRGAKAAGACADGKFKVGVQRDVSNTRVC
jgi:hypothetical protein